MKTFYFDFHDLFYLDDAFEFVHSGIQKRKYVSLVIQIDQRILAAESKGILVPCLIVLPKKDFYSLRKIFLLPEKDFYSLREIFTP